MALGSSRRLGHSIHHPRMAGSCLETMHPPQKRYCWSEAQVSCDSSLSMGVVDTPNVPKVYRHSFFLQSRMKLRNQLLLRFCLQLVRKG